MLKHTSYTPALVLLILVLFSSCSNDLEKVKALTEVENYADVTVHNLNTLYSANALVKVELQAKLAEKYITRDEPFTDFQEGIYVNFYDDSLKSESKLTADYAIYYDKTKLGKAEKNVRLTNQNGSVLKTEQLFIDEKDNKIYSIKPVNITDKDGSTINSKGGFKSNLAFTVYQFTKVDGEIIQKIDEFNTADDNAKAENLK